MSVVDQQEVPLVSKRSPSRVLLSALSASSLTRSVVADQPTSYQRRLSAALNSQADFEEEFLEKVSSRLFFGRQVIRPTRQAHCHCKSHSPSHSIEQDVASANAPASSGERVSDQVQIHPHILDWFVMDAVSRCIKETGYHFICWLHVPSGQCLGQIFGIAEEEGWRGRPMRLNKGAHSRR